MDARPRDEPAIEVETGSGPSASVIWLHGLGADGQDFEVIIPELRLPTQPVLRFVFPHAPYRPVTINGGYIMRAWYDIAMSERGLEQNLEHIRESKRILQGLIENEIQRGIACERIVLAGFSQGGAIALHTGLRYSKSLAGIMSLSAPVPFAESLMAEVDPANATIPVFMAHGTDDRMIRSPAVITRNARSFLVFCTRFSHSCRLHRAENASRLRAKCRNRGSGGDGLTGNRGEALWSY